MRVHLFCCCCCSRPNFLILDEPTNHLDVATVDALGRALSMFKVQKKCLLFENWEYNQVASLRQLVVTDLNLTECENTLCIIGSCEL